MSEAILPGAALGVLGGGQLGRMFALAARAMGYRVHMLTDAVVGPCAGVADRLIVAPYDDADAAARLAREVSVVTFEFENVAAAAVEAAAGHAPTCPGAHVLHIAQHRLREKSALEKMGVAVPPFRPVRAERDLDAALRHTGLPALLKTAASGYDGKGQAVVRDAAHAMDCWQSLGRVECIVESFVAFERELSVVVARNSAGQSCAYAPFENEHRDHILDITTTPAAVSATVAQEAMATARHIAESLDLVGVLCVEFFLAPGEKLLVNELAPRPHNSGHLTIDANVTSQFEQQVRAICGLPLGSTAALAPAAAMANLLGDLWSAGEPNWRAALDDDHMKLHLYGKPDPRPGRKMGHLTATGTTPAEARQRVLAARAALTPAPTPSHP